METAATTRPDGPRTGADTEATPASRSPTLCAQPAAADAGQGGRGELGARAGRGAGGPAPPRPAAPGRPTRRASSSVAPIGIESRRPDGTLGGGDADAVVALAAEQLGALVGVVAQGAEHRPCGGEQPVLAGGRCQLGEPGAEHEAPLEVAGDQAVVLQRHGQPVGRRAGQSGRGHQLCKGRRAGLEGAQDDGCLVENADPTRVVHGMILPSHSMRRKSGPLPCVPTWEIRAAWRTDETRARAGRSRRRRSGTRVRNFGREGVGRACGASCGGRTGPPLHRPPPHPRGHLARRRSTASASPAAPSAGRTSPWPPRTTTSRRPPGPSPTW